MDNGSAGRDLMLLMCHKRKDAIARAAGARLGITDSSIASKTW